MASEAITRNDLTNILNEVLPIAGGEVYTAAWTASASSSANYHLTDSISLPAGVYVVTITVPLASGAMLVSLSSGAPPYYTLGSLQEATQVLVLQSPQSVYLQSSGSTSVTYSYLERGGLKAVRISGLPFTTQADTIVEQGTSGIWTYRKWNSGIAECWGKESKTVNISIAYGSTYVSSEIGRIAYPFEFASVPCAKVTLCTTSSWVLAGSDATTTQTPTYYLSRATTANQAVVILHEAIGRWK